MMSLDGPCAGRDSGIGEILLLRSRVEVSGCMSMEVSGESCLRIVRESVQESIP